MNNVHYLPSRSTRSAPRPGQPTAGTGKHNLPAPATRVVGRAGVIDLLAETVRTTPLLSVIGAGGIGKTTVALAVAERVQETFPDGVWLVDFAPLRDPSLVPHAIASATGLAVHSADILAAVCRFVRDRQILLVLDNCEHMVAAIAACASQILQDAPGVHILTTSRAALRIAGEHVHRLAGLSSPDNSAGLTAAQALGYPAIELFVDRATDRLETFVLCDDEAPVVADICRNLDGIALAIELAAMRIDVFGVKGLQQQLSDRFRLLSGRRGGLERHRTLVATLDWSYGLLLEPEAALLRAVAVFPGAFRLAGAASVADVTPAVAAATLAELAAKSLLSVEGDGVAVTYRALEITRAYCLDKLIDAGEQCTMSQRHAEYVCAVVQSAAAEWGQQLSRDWGAAYGWLLGDLRTALAWTSAAPAGSALLIALTAAGTLLWNHFSLTDESRAHLTQAVARLGAAGAEGTTVEMNLQFALAGAILYTRGIVPDARFASRRAMDLSEQLGDTDFRLRCLRLSGTIELFSGEPDTGIRTLENFLSLATLEDPAALAEGETHLGVGETFVGRLHDARQRMERLAIQDSQDFNDARFARFQYSNSVNLLIVLSHAQFLTGLPDAAARSAETILLYGRAAKHELSLCIGLAWNSLLYFWLGREEECSRQAAMLDELVETHGIVTWRPIATFCRGALTGDIEVLARAVVQFRETGHMARLPFYVGVLAEAYGKQARFLEAEATIQEALALAASQNEQWCLPELLRIQAFIASMQGQLATAAEVLQQAIAVAAAIGALAWQLRAATDLATLLHAQSRSAEARRILRATYDRFSEGEASRDLVAAARLLAELR